MKAPWKFLWRFAWQDLQERHALIATLANVSSVALVVGFLVVSFGLTWGAERLQLERLRRNPLNLYFWVGDPNVSQVSAGFLESLRTDIAAAVGTGLRGCHPFSEVNDFIWYDDQGRSRPREFRGRTLSPDDPFLQSIDLQSGRRRLETDAVGVVATVEMLKRLGFDGERPPETLLLETPGGKPSPVPLLDVTATKLPLEHDYLMADTYEMRIRRENPDRPEPQVRATPVPREWPKIAELPASIMDMLTTYHINRPIADEVDDHFEWVLTHDPVEQTPTVSQWRSYLLAINAQMVKLGFPTAPASFAELAVTEAVPDPAPRTDYDFVGVYLNNVDSLRPAADACRRLRPNRDVIDQVVAIGNGTKTMMRTLTIIGVLIGLVTMLNLGIVQLLRYEQRVAEFGMLKAMGMPPQSLRNLSLVQAAMVWMFGGPGGVVLGFVVGWIVAWSRHGSDARWAFQCPPFATSIVLAISLAMCLVSSWLATRKSRVAPPCQSLRGN